MQVPVPSNALKYATTTFLLLKSVCVRQLQPVIMLQSTLR